MSADRILVDTRKTIPGISATRQPAIPQAASLQNDRESNSDNTDLLTEERPRRTVPTKASSSPTLSDTPSSSLVGKSPEISRNTRTSVGNRDTSEDEKPNCTAVQEKNTPAKMDSTNAQTREVMGEYVIDRIVSNDLDEVDAKLRYQVRWYGYSPDADTLETIENLLRPQVVRYHRRKKLLLPANLLDALVGLLVVMLHRDALDYRNRTKGTTPERRDGKSTEDRTTKAE